MDRLLGSSIGKSVGWFSLRKQKEQMGTINTYGNTIIMVYNYSNDVEKSQSLFRC